MHTGSSKAFEEDLGCGGLSLCPTCEYSLHCVLKVEGVDGLVSLSGSVQGGFVAYVCDVGACRKTAGWQWRLYFKHEMLSADRIFF